MDIDGSDDIPPYRETSMPPSSMPDPTEPQPSASTRPRLTALGLDDDEPNGEPAQKKRKPRPRTQNGAEIPLVKDRVGETVEESFTQFLESFTEGVALAATPGSEGEAPETDEANVYVNQIHDLAKYKLTTLYVDFNHILQVDDLLADVIQKQYYRLIPFLRRTVYNLIEKYEPQYLSVESASNEIEEKTREFNVAFYHLPLVSGIRDLRTDKIGTLVSISGTVTRTSEVRPELLFGTFICEICRAVVRDVEQQFKYTQPALCPTLTCGNRTAWQLQIDASTFTDWQKVRIQENPSEIPTGSMPRSLDVILRDELVERAKAGDKCVFTGTFIVVPDVSQLGLPGGNKAQLQREASKAGATVATGGIGSGVTGLKTLGVRDLQYKTAFLACMAVDSDARSGTNVRGEETVGEESAQAYIDTLTDPEFQELKTMIDSENIYARLVGSIAPTVYGHDVVKKGLLLQLMGGVHKETKEGMHLRGDINICIVGDPSTSKSQFLKYVCSFLPRAVYTSGKASSAAGLTAAVVKDEETGDFTIEAGALMLADNGICAIDEFDKMDVADQVAIHEAMEQQTISIAKAGIHATLNARTSILAAANPVGGRYDRKKSLRANIQMSGPIMSRFDLFFVVLDQCDPKTDLNLAKHIVNVHRFQDEAIQPEFSTETLQRYIRYARTFSPKMSPEAADLLVEKYRLLRQDDAGGKNSYRITVRQLESMIRLSEAIARANCTSVIIPAYVREAYNLLRQSIIHVEQDDIDFDEEELEGEREPVNRQANNVDESQDVEMAAPDSESQDQSSMLTSSTGQAHVSAANATAGSSSQTDGAEPSEAAAAPAPPKRRMVITHDMFLQLQSLIVYHIAEVERTSGQGVDKDELIDWYLELKESEMEDLEQVEYEKELITKMLRKLVKDNYLLEVKGDVQESLPSVDENGQSSMPADGENVRVYYMVHPGVDTEGSSLSMSSA